MDGDAGRVWGHFEGYHLSGLFRVFLLQSVEDEGLFEGDGARRAQKWRGWGCGGAWIREKNSENFSKISKNEKNLASKAILGGRNGAKKGADDELKLVAEFVMSKTDVNELVKKLQTVDLLEQILFDDGDQASLIPLVLLKAAQKKLKVKNFGGNLEIDKNRNSSENGNLEPRVGLFRKKNAQIHPESAPNTSKLTQKLSYKQIFDSLKNGQKQQIQDSGFKSMVKEYMIDHLTPVFTPEPTQNTPKSAQNSPDSKSENSEAIVFTVDKLDARAQNLPSEGTIHLNLRGRTLSQANILTSKQDSDSFSDCSSPFTGVKRRALKLRVGRKSVLRKVSLREKGQGQFRRVSQFAKVEKGRRVWGRS